MIQTKRSTKSSSHLSYADFGADAGIVLIAIEIVLRLLKREHAHPSDAITTPDNLEQILGVRVFGDFLVPRRLLVRSIRPSKVAD
jgi:hypothetical protein